jgi:hypothetical protein
MFSELIDHNMVETHNRNVFLHIFNNSSKLGWSFMYIMIGRCFSELLGLHFCGTHLTSAPFIWLLPLICLCAHNWYSTLFWNGCPSFFLVKVVCMLLSTNSWHIASLSLRHHFCAFAWLWGFICNYSQFYYGGSRYSKYLLCWLRAGPAVYLEHLRACYP